MSVVVSERCIGSPFYEPYGRIGPPVVCQADKWCLPVLVGGVDVASAEKDKASQDFLWSFVREQVEEEATAAGLVEKIKKAGDSGLLFLDSQLAQR